MDKPIPPSLIGMGIDDAGRIASSSGLDPATDFRLGVNQAAGSKPLNRGGISSSFLRRKLDDVLLVQFPAPESAGKQETQTAQMRASRMPQDGPGVPRPRDPSGHRVTLLRGQSHRVSIGPSSVLCGVVDGSQWTAYPTA